MTTNPERSITVSIRGPIERSDLPDLTTRVCALLSSSRGCVVYCDVSNVRVDAVAVEALARLQLAARRHGCQVFVRRPSAELREILGIMGLAAALPEQP